MQVSDGTANGADQMGSIVLVVVALSADPVEQLSTFGQFSHQVHFFFFFFFFWENQ
jgi:hypothetical protein